jgi:hypothetical protein
MLDLRRWGAIRALPPPQARNKAGLTGIGHRSCLSRMHALRGQEVQSKVSDWRASGRLGYRSRYVLGKMPASTTTRVFRSTMIFYIPEK